MMTDKRAYLADLNELTRLIEHQLLLDAAAAAEVELAVRKWYVRKREYLLTLPPSPLPSDVYATIHGSNTQDGQPQNESSQSAPRSNTEFLGRVAKIQRIFNLRLGKPGDRSESRTFSLCSRAAFDLAQETKEKPNRGKIRARVERMLAAQDPDPERALKNLRRAVNDSEIPWSRIFGNLGIPPE